MKQMVLTFLVAAALGAGLASGCASVDKFNVVAADVTHDAIVASEQHRCSVHWAPCLTDDKFKAVNVELHKVSVAGTEFTKLRLAGHSTIGDAHTFLAVVAEETAILSKTFQTGAIAEVLAELAKLQTQATKLLGN